MEHRGLEFGAETQTSTTGRKSLSRNRRATEVLAGTVEFGRDGQNSKTIPGFIHTGSGQIQNDFQWNKASATKAFI